MTRSAAKNYHLIDDAASHMTMKATATEPTLKGHQS